MTKTVPANVAQTGIWLAQQLSPPGYMFNLAEYVSLRGPIDVGLLLRSLHLLAAEAEAARATLAQTDHGLQMRIGLAPDHVPLLDFSDAPDPLLAARAWMSRDLQDHDRGLWRVAVLRLGQDHHLWYHCAHHAVLDGYSGGLLARRAAQLYSALLAGDDPPPAGFAPAEVLTTAERDYRANARYQRDSAYWRDMLADLPDPVTLAHGGERTGGVLRAMRQLTQADSTALRELAASLSLSLPQVMVAAFAGYLHRMTGADDIVLAMPVMGRMSAAERDVPIMAANAVPLRFRLGTGDSFADLARQVSRVMMGAMRRQKYRFEHIRHDLGMTRIDQQIASVAVNFEPFDYDLRFGDIRAEVENLSNGSVDDLTCFIFDRGGRQGLQIVLDANPGLYAQDELDRHAERLTAFIGGVMADAQAPLRDLGLFLPGEAQQIAAWSQGPAVDVAGTWLDAFDAQLARTPDAIASRDGHDAFSYAGLDRAARSIARVMVERGVGRGDKVAVLMDRSTLLPASLMAIHRLGAAYVPLDPAAPDARNRLILREAAPKLVLTSRPVDGALVVDQAVLGGGGMDWPAPALGDDLAYLIFTSGSTGVPKGVEVQHAPLAALLGAMRDALALDRGTRWLAVTTIAFDIATLELLAPLIAGGTVEIATRSEVLDPDLLNARIEKSAITHLQATPSLWRLMLDGSHPRLGGLVKLAGGEALPRDLAQRLVGGGPLFNVYGPTETTIWSSIARIEPGFDGTPPIGRPLPGESLHILDRHGDPVPPGSIGEIWIGGAGLARGYHAQPDLTAQRFVTGAQGRLYRTGDLGRWRKDGQAEHLGRLDFQLKIRGYRVEAGEVEAAMRAFPAIRAAAVIADGPDALAGYVTAPAPIDMAALERHLADHLPRYMVPQSLMQIDAMPLNPNGKLDIKALPAIPRDDAAPAPVDCPILCRVMALAQDALDRPVGPDADFFHMGATSLSAARMIAALRREFATDLPLAAVFANPTPRALAREIDRAAASEPLAPLLKLREARGDAPVLFCVHPVLGIGWSYTALLQALPQEFGLYVLQSPGLTKDARWPDLRTMARDYVARIAKVQPAGPYHLAGWSFGGLVAQEMTAQLEASGARVATLCLLDAFPFVAEAGPVCERDRVRQTLAFLGEAPDTAITTLDDLARMIATRPEIEALRVDVGPERFDTLQTAIRDVAEANLTVARLHVPDKVQAPILHFRATQGKSAALDGLLHWRDNPWRDHSGGGAVCIDVPCGHNDMLGPVSIATVAPYLDAALKRGAAMA